VLTLRSVPRLLAALLGLLAFAAVVFLLGSIFATHAGDLAVLGVLGMRRGAMLRVASVVAAWTASVALLLSVPIGVLLGRVAWRALTHRLHLASGPVGAATAIVVVWVSTAVALNVAALASARRRVGQLALPLTRG
jgi:hypothetical protein